MPRLELGAVLGAVGFIFLAITRVPIFRNWISTVAINKTARYYNGVETNMPIMAISGDIDAWVVNTYIRQSCKLSNELKCSLESITNTLGDNEDEFMLSQVKHITMTKSGMEVLTIALNNEKQWVMFIDINEYDDYCTQWSTRVGVAIILVAVLLVIW